MRNDTAGWVFVIGSRSAPRWRVSAPDTTVADVDEFSRFVREQSEYLERQRVSSEQHAGRDVADAESERVIASQVGPNRYRFSVDGIPVAELWWDDTSLNPDYEDQRRSEKTGWVLESLEHRPFLFTSHFRDATIAGTVGVDSFEPYDQATVVRVVAGQLARNIRERRNTDEDEARASGLIDLLGPQPCDPFGEVWEDAVEALAELGRRALRPLTRALDHSDPSTRAGAAAALGRIGLQQSVRPLASVLADPDIGVRVYAARALGEIGGADALGELVAFEEVERARVRAGEVPDAVNAAVDALIALGYYEGYAE